MKINRESDKPSLTTSHWMIEAKEGNKSVCVDVFSDDIEWGKRIEAELHKALKKVLKGGDDV